VQPLRVRRPPTYRQHVHRVHLTDSAKSVLILIAAMLPILILVIIARILGF